MMRLGLYDPSRVRRRILDRGQGFRPRPARPDGPVQLMSDESALCDLDSILQELLAGMEQSATGVEFLPYDKLTEIIPYTKYGFLLGGLNISRNAIATRTILRQDSTTDRTTAHREVLEMIESEERFHSDTFIFEHELFI